MQTIITKIRALIGDRLVPGSDIYTYGNSKVFTLSEGNIGAVVDVFRNDVDSSVTYTYNSASCKLTVTSALTTGDTVQIDYTYYGNYSDTEITDYIQAALIHLCNNNYYNFEYDSVTDDIYPTPEPREENLIALITSLLIEPDNKKIRLPDITITGPEDLPTDRKIARAIARFKKDSHGIFDIIGEE